MSTEAQGSEEVVASPPTRGVTLSPKSRRLLIIGAFAVVVWLAGMEFFSRRYGVEGPAELFGREFFFGPKRGRVIWASLLMCLVALTNRERVIALVTAAVIDLAFVLGRLPFDTRLTYGNGPLWVMVGIGVWGYFKAAPERRANILKGVGLGFALVIGTKAGDAYLLMTTRTKPLVLDQYVQNADHALGNPSWLLGRVLDRSGSVVRLIVQTIYIELPVAAMLLAIWQIRKGWPRHTFVKTFLLIAAIGPICYLIFPVVGPIYAYGPMGGDFALADVWPNTLPFHQELTSFRFDTITPRNCMPSLHTAWAFAIYIHTRREVPVVKWLGAIWFFGTMFATLAFGWHYGVDLVAGIVFTATIETAIRAPERGTTRARIAQVVLGVVVFVAMLWSYRFLSEPMADQPWVSGPLLLASMSVVLLGFYRQFFGRWNDWKPEHGDS